MSTPGPLVSEINRVRQAMLGKLFRKTIEQEIKKSGRQPLLSSQSVRIFNYVLLVWLISSVVLTLIAESQNWDSLNCALCNQVAEVIPSINDATINTSNPKALRILWLYLALTSPMVLLVLITKVKSVQKAGITFPVFAIFFGLFFVFFIVAVSGALIRDGDGYFIRLYRDTLVGGIAYSCAIWTCAVSFLAYSVLMSVSVIKGQK